MRSKIETIREAIFDFDPRTYTFHINTYRENKEKAEGIFRVMLLGGKDKLLKIKLENGNLEVKEE